MLTILWKSLLQTNYDVAACYHDSRIIPKVAMLANRQFGVHPMVTSTNKTTLQSARYHVRMKMGLCNTCYTHEKSNPIHRTGQGSANVSLAFSLSDLFDCYKQQSFPAQLYYPDHSNALKLSMVGFVNDCNGQVNSFYGAENESTAIEIHG